MSQLGVQRRFWRDGISNKRLSHVHRSVLMWLSDKPYRGVLPTMALPLVGFALFPQLPEQFFPTTDRDQFPIEQGPPFAAPIEKRLFGPGLERLQELGNQVRLRSRGTARPEDQTRRNLRSIRRRNPWTAPSSFNQAARPTYVRHDAKLHSTALFAASVNKPCP
jgi:hypothetical protein